MVLCKITYYYLLSLYHLQVYFGTQFGKMYLSCDFLGINCITGMSCLFRRSVLDEAGGLKALGQYLAEDYYLGKIFLDKYVLECCVTVFVSNKQSDFLVFVILVSYSHYMEHHYTFEEFCSQTR